MGKARSSGVCETGTTRNLNVDICTLSVRSGVVNGELWATWTGIGVSASLAIAALLQGWRANARTTRLAAAADQREAKRLAIDLEHRKVTWEIRYVDGCDDALAMTHVGATPAEDVLVTVRANGWPTRRETFGVARPDDVLVVDLSEEHAAHDAESGSEAARMGWYVRVEWRSPAGAPDSWQYAVPALSR